MAITVIEYTLLTELRKSGLLPSRPRILELGEANWYGDVPLDQLISDTHQFVADAARRSQLLEKLDHLIKTKPPHAPFDIAKIFYAAFFDYQSITAIDFHGTESALKIDLNQPVQLEAKYDLVVNDGTGEHICNIGQFLRTIHEVTVPGGIMYHNSPFSGWFDHGFYSINPTLYFDLARANGYQILILVYGELTPAKIVRIDRREQISAMVQNGQIGTNSCLCCLLQKARDDREFRFPMQGYYAGTISDESKAAWHTLR